MTPDQTKIVQSTWAQVVPIADTAAQLFYGKLFELDPSLRPLFAKADMDEQRQKLMATLGAAPANWLGQWLLFYLLYKIAMGVLIGWLLRHGWRVGVAERAGGVPPDAA